MTVKRTLASLACILVLAAAGPVSARLGDALPAPNLPQTGSGVAAIAMKAAENPVAVEEPASPPKRVIARIIIQNGHASPISAAAWTPDGRFLLTGSTDAELLVWDLASHIVARANLGSSSDRTVVERIGIAPDGRSVAIDEIWFKDMWDNGVGSELHRRSYTYRFGDSAAVPRDDVLVEPKWKPGTAFLAGSLAMKAALFNRTDLPKSSLGWSLKRAGGVLTMLPPTPGAAAIRLTGALGAAPDEGDRRLEAVARLYELRGPPEFIGARPTPTPLFDFGRRTGPPRLSPDGNLLAWLETSKEQVIVHVMDMQGGAIRPSVKFTSTKAVTAIGWTGATTLVALRTDAPAIGIDAGGSHVEAIAPTQPVNDLTTIPLCPASETPSITLCLTAKGQVEVRSPANAGLRCVAVIDETQDVPAAYASASVDRTKIALQAESGYTELFDVSAANNGRKCPSIAAWRAVPGRVGFHPTKPLFWIEGRSGTLAYYPLDALRSLNWNSESAAAPLFTLYRLPGDRFFTIDRDGLYDTNLGPDAEAVRWQVSDAPFQSFPAQTFMRDYFEPRLIERRISCTSAGTCAQAFKPLPPIAQLNRVLPSVQIMGVRAEGKTAIVTVRVAEGIDPGASNAKTHSGVYAVRLFRNGQLILQHPEPVYRAQQPGNAEFDASVAKGIVPNGANASRMLERQPEAVAAGMANDIALWRKLNRIDQATSTNTVDLNFQIQLPTDPNSGVATYSAYAFNEDRVKSETQQVAVTLPVPTPPRPRRAFVITIGIDAYDEPRLALRFAASDAQLIGDRLAAIPGYEVRRLSLSSAKGADGKARRVTRDTILLLLSALAGGDPGVSTAAIHEWGFDVPGLDTATPDDIVILSFSGHGWADPQGNFYLVPADAKWKSGALAPDTSTLISAAELALNFTAIKAGEVAIIIDACHSGASVDAGGFKPGPMGDAGLGQLAFDKGLRILAASQASDVALEDPVLRQGLLTYALAGEGITADGGKADENQDRRITLDEWLRYAVRRLPDLSDDARLGRFGGGTASASGSRDFDLLDATPEARTKPQEPALFDFTGKASAVVLRNLPQ